MPTAVTYSDISTAKQKSAVRGVIKHSADIELSASDICSIVKECRVAGVLDFTYRDLKFSFTQKVEEVKHTAAEERAVENVSRETEADPEGDLAELMLTNPSEFERLTEKIIHGENNQGTESVLRRG